MEYKKKMFVSHKMCEYLHARIVSKTFPYASVGSQVVHIIVIWKFSRNHDFITFSIVRLLRYFISQIAVTFCLIDEVLRFALYMYVQSFTLQKRALDNIILDDL